jgi:hypothetical protein
MPKHQASTEDAATVDSDAMDIDSNTPPTERPRPLATGSDRTFKPGTPIKFSATSAQPAPSPQDPPKAKAGTKPKNSAPPSSSATEAPTSPGLNGIAGLRNVEPFAPPTNGSGLSGLADLNDTLPFKSKPSASHPTKSNSAQKLKYPNVPGAPQPPTTLDESSTRIYLTQMERYVKSFRDYNKTMMQHFAARDVELESLDEHFILNRGETSKKLGFASYMKRMKEDNSVLEAWKLAQEMHLLAMQTCADVRTKRLKLADV